MKNLFVIPVLLLASFVNGQILTPEVEVTTSTNGQTIIGTDSQSLLHSIGETRLENPDGLALQIRRDDGDSWLMFHDPGQYWFSMGIDRSDGGKFKINNGGTLGAYNHFTMTSAGKFGFGTTSPISPLHVVSSFANEGLKLGATGQSTVISLHVSSLDYGYFNLGGGTTFRGGGQNSSFGGNVGVGTSSPGSNLSIYGLNSEGWDSGIRLDREDGGQAKIAVDNQGLKLRTTKSGDHFYFRNDLNQTNVIFTATGNVGIGYTSPSYKLDVNGTIRGSNVSPSDRRYKKDISQLKTQNLQLINGYQYKLKSNDSFHYGVIAQEVEEIFPHMVSTDDQGYKSVAYDEFIPLLIEESKSQRAEIEILKKEINSLKKLLIQAKK